MRRISRHGLVAGGASMKASNCFYVAGIEHWRSAMWRKWKGLEGLLDLGSLKDQKSSSAGLWTSSRIANSESISTGDAMVCQAEKSLVYLKLRDWLHGVGVMSRTTVPGMQGTPWTSLKLFLFRGMTGVYGSTKGTFRKFFSLEPQQWPGIQWVLQGQVLSEYQERVVSRG